MAPERVLVTGGTGFLGGWCIHELLRQGRAVNATVRSATGGEALKIALAAAGAPTENLAVFLADLGADRGWAEALSEVGYVLHIASPTSMDFTDDPQRLLELARGGALRVLRAARDADVARVVVTSSTYATAYPQGGDTRLSRTEEDWTDTDAANITPYVRAKTLAERAAWQFAEAEWERSRLATICPAGIIGPLMSPQIPDSMQLIIRLLRGKMPALPQIALPLVDVRDCADLHCRAALSAAAGGERFIASGPALWMKDLALLIKSELGSIAARVKTDEMPNWTLRAAAALSPDARLILPDLGVQRSFSSEKAQSVLHWSPRPLETTLADAAASLKRFGLLE